MKKVITIAIILLSISISFAELIAEKATITKVYFRIDNVSTPSFQTDKTGPSKWLYLTNVTGGCTKEATAFLLMAFQNKSSVNVQGTISTGQVVILQSDD